MRLHVFFWFPFTSMKGGTPTTNSYSRQPKDQRSDWPLYSWRRKNSGGVYSSVPKNVVVDTPLFSFLVVTLDDETEEEELASSAIVPRSGFGGKMERPKSHSFVYPSLSMSTFSGLRLISSEQHS